MKGYLFFSIIGIAYLIINMTIIYFIPKPDWWLWIIAFIPPFFSFGTAYIHRDEDWIEEEV